MQANLEVGGCVYDDFDHVPFAGCGCACYAPPRDPQAACSCGVKAQACIKFERTTNPYWFDWADRREPKHTLAEEVAYDDALRLGDTSLSFRAWLRERRAGELGFEEIEPLPV